jgi:hypothetical protein
MNIQRVLVVVAFCAATMAVSAQTPESGTQPDNTKVNKRDRKAGQVTADQHKENEGDRKLTQDIRRSIMEDKSLSTYAHNVKIISQNGTFSLILWSRATVSDSTVLAWSLTSRSRARKRRKVRWALSFTASVSI